LRQFTFGWWCLKFATVHIRVVVFEICLEMVGAMELTREIKLGLDHVLDPRDMIEGGSRRGTVTLQLFEIC
jgi:hypothetical protein